MSRPASLFDEPSPEDGDFLLLDDLTTLVALRLLEEHPSPAGPVYALTALGQDTPEFGQLRHRNVVNLFYSKGDQGLARVRSEELIEASLRMRPDRVLMQELRDGAAFSFIRGVASGHPGSITTCHAETPDGAFDVLRLMVKQHEAGKHMADADTRTLLRQHIDVVIHCAKDPYRITQVYFDPAAKLAAAACSLPSFPALAAE